MSEHGTTQSVVFSGIFARPTFCKERKLDLRSEARVFRNHRDEPLTRCGIRVRPLSVWNHDLPTRGSTKWRPLG